MRNTFFLNSNGQNLYLLDKSNQQLLICHPLIQIFYELEKKGFEIAELIKNTELRNSLNELKNYSEKEIMYYGKKYNYLLDNNFFSCSENQTEFNLTNNSIKKALANLRQITFEVTDACNLNCKYCAYGELYGNYDKRKNSYLDFEKGKVIIDYLHAILNSSRNQGRNKKFYVSYYGGEPLLNMNFVKRITEYLKSKKFQNNQIVFSMTTNAVLLDKHIEYLVDNNFQILISLDGDRKNNEYRVFSNGSPSYDLILSNIIKLKNKYPKYFNESVQFNATLHNKNSVDSIYHFFKNKFNKTPSIGELSSSGIREDKRSKFNEMYENTSQSMNKSHHYMSIENDMFMQLPSLKLLGMFLHNHSGNVFKDYRNILFRSKYEKKLSTGTCIPFERKMFITVNGKILPCEKIGQQYVIGWLNGCKVDINIEFIKNFYKEKFNKIKHVCSSCYNFNNCKTCIFDLNIEDEYPTCDGFMDRKAYKQFLSSIVSYLEFKPYLYKKIMDEVYID